MCVRRTLLLLGMLAACSGLGRAQEVGDDLCSLIDDGNRPVAAKQDISPPAILSLLASKAGLKGDDFHLIAWSQPPVKGNAFAQYCAKQRWNSIFYDPSFVPTTTASSDDVWFARFVFAHEVGHHVKNHFRGPPKLRPDKEAEADEWAGWALEKIGAPVDALMAAVDRLQPSDIATDKYYSRCHRRTDALLGYNNAARDDGKLVYETCLECYPASAAGLYLTRDLAIGSRFSADSVRVCGSKGDGPDRPRNYLSGLEGGCLATNGRRGSLLTWDNVALCK
jgi:hypothetical protein